jgi:hypothetical protein
MAEFRLHFGFIQFPKIDPQTKQRIPATVKSQLICVRNYVKHAIINGVIYSIFIPCSFQPFSPSRPDTDVYIATDIKQLLNNLLVAVMVSWSLVFSMNGVGSIIQVVGGFQTEDVVNNPMFGSTSPSDFWGNRWNKLDSSRTQIGSVQARSGGNWITEFGDDGHLPSVWFSA